MTGLRAVFIDRDGVLTEERSDYVKTPEELRILPGVPHALSLIREKAFLLVVVTNQSVVGRGLTTHHLMSKIHEKLLHELQKAGCQIDAVYYCPHRPDERCFCRKPQPGLILKAAEDLDIDTAKSWVVGDKDTDLEAAQRAGCRGIKIPTNGDKLADAVGVILSDEESSMERLG